MSATDLQALENNNLERCRICLESDLPLYSLSCNCKGELGRVHDYCMSKWVATLIARNPNQAEVKCEICGKVIYTSPMNKKLKCKRMKEMKPCEVIGFIAASAVLILFIVLALVLGVAVLLVIPLIFSGALFIITGIKAFIKNERQDFEIHQSGILLKETDQYVNFESPPKQDKKDKK